MSRTLSYTEISTALTCWAQWDFAYGGRLAGSTLKARESAPMLRAGSAWGAGVAAWHRSGDPLEASSELWRSLLDDARRAAQRGFPIEGEVTWAQGEELCAVLDHYIDTAEPLPTLTQLEGELNVPIPSRTGRRGSNRYRFHCFIDGHAEAEHPWLVEFKFRGALTPRAIVDRQPQYRWYALAYALAEGIPGPVGVLLDERLNVAPKPARVLRNGKASQDKQQMTTAALYVRECRSTDTPADQAVVDALNARQWQQRIALVFSRADLEEAADELRSSAQLIRDLDSGRLFPIRNGKRSNCQSCRYAGVCKDPGNDFLVNSLFTRTKPKRLRPDLRTSTRVVGEAADSESVCSTSGANGADATPRPGGHISQLEGIA